ncbi:MAG: cell division/cell wall cluster transcriptional repressor MraZ [Paludibacteraceae bacterium]|nr:cell division/cell wall cluster transcriptional repressor MraZ [Bacteroidales bacterium]MBO5828423.1 cell division/cell wall cluster transcriptional repressor MraZ [Paludibacteraceae bacterium]MBQ9101062.1 cell division/cell wall cluster transcriptional repressor MraZ [Paludibacteraceae bacterium]MBR6659871.1 cell division/cell wall cluster transcriptional repressor MraZ [Paludibacteraceae bacterium]MEE0912651.1 cell division/cell wall cluster transcriptional repressor MraZ [Paludibacteracea
MCRFSGNMDVKVDGKGRLFVPAAFRRALEGDSTLFLRVDTVSKCAKFYPASEWEKLNAQFMSQLNLWNQSDLRLYRQFSAGVEQVDLDASGRILIQRRNLDLLEITSEALVVGVGKYFEVWNKDLFEDSLLDDEAFSKALQEKMGNQMVL